MNEFLNLASLQALFSRLAIGNRDASTDVFKSDDASKWEENQISLLNQIEVSQKPLFEKRFSVYRNNVHHSLVQALADTFPVVQQLVGEEFFTMMAKQYLYVSPPASAVLLEFGEGFHSFIESFKPAQSLGYLSDVAALEYSWQQAYHAEDAQSLDAGLFASVPAESLSEQRLPCHPSLTLVHSEFSVGSIWQAHQSEADCSENDLHPKIDVDNPEWLVVVRPEYEVQVCFVDEPSYDFIDRLLQGHTPGSAMAELIEVFPEWDIGSALAFAVQNGFFVRSEDGQIQKN